MVKRLKCFILGHQHIEVFEVYYTLPGDVLDLGAWRKHCCRCGKVE